MTEAEARELEAYWGAPGPPPAASWRCCMWCGDYWPPDARYWADGRKRKCRACKHGSQGLCRECGRRRVRPHYPRSRQWLRKNRWTPDGRIVRRCLICARWKPLTAYYLIRRNDAKRRTRHYYPRPICIACEIARKRYRSIADMRRALRERSRAERERQAA